MIELTEQEIESGLNSAKTSRKYDYLVLFLLSILQIFLHSNSSAYPILFKQPRFICNSLNETTNEVIFFNRNCSKFEVCSKNLTKGLDFVINENSLDSLVAELDIYCNPFQISVLESAIFAGPALSILLTPYLLNNLGPIYTLKICGSVYVCFMLLLFQMKNIFLVTVSFYGIFICTYTMYNCKSIYIVEMCESKKRSLFYGILNVNSGIAGIFVVIVIQYFNDIKIIFFCNVLAIVFVILVVHFKVVESIRFSFLNKEYNNIVRDLRIIAEFNQNSDKYEEWLIQVNEGDNVKYDLLNISHDKINDKEVELNNVETNDESFEKANQNSREGKKSKYSKALKNINFFSILRFKSQIKTIIIFTFVIFTIKFSNVFLLLELGHTKTLNNMILFFCIDSITNIVSAILVEKPWIGRKKFTFFVMVINGLLFLFGFFWYRNNKYNFLLNLINRIFVSGGLTVILLYNFESYPTLIRATSSSFNKFFAMLFNIFTPYLITSFRLIMFLISAALFFIGSYLVLGLKETQGRKLKELPPEIADHDKKEQTTIN